MKELVRSNDPVFLSWLQAVLADARIECHILDNHTSVIEGSISAIARRLMVAEEDHSRASWILESERPDAAGGTDAGGV